MIPANKLANVRRRAARARRWPVNTCPASRHVELIADSFAATRNIAAWDREDAQFCAASLYSVLESLWKARTELQRIKGKK